MNSPPTKKSLFLLQVGLEYFLGASCIIDSLWVSQPSEALEFKKVSLTIQLNNQLTNSMEHSLSMNLTVPQLVKKFPAYYETPRFITASTTVCHLSYPQPDPFHALISNFLMIHLNIILPSNPGSSKWFNFLRFLTKTVYTPFLYPIRTTYPSHLIRLDLIT